MGSTWLVAPDGTDGGDGSAGHPWSLGHALSGAAGAIEAGDVVLLRGGTYRPKRYYRVTVSGAQGLPVTFAAHPGEPAPLLDGAIPDFQNGPYAPEDEPWELVEGRKGHFVYRSKKAFEDAAHYGGLISVRGPLLNWSKFFSLAPHLSVEYLRSDVHLWKPYPTPRYLGPGVAHDRGTGRIYIRLDDSRAEARGDRPCGLPTRDPNPNKHRIHIAANGTWGLWIEGSHLRFEGLRFRGSYGCWTIPTEPFPTDLVFADCTGEPNRVAGRLGGSTGVKVLGGKYDGHMHSESWWVSHSDIKAARGEEGAAAGRVRKCGFDLGEASAVELGPSPTTGQRMVVRQFFDGLLGGIKDIEVHGIWFDEMWDDAWQQTSKISNVEYHDNVHFGAGPSRDGSSSVTPAGTIWIHDNVIDTTVHLIFWFRRGFPNAPVAILESIPFNRHGAAGATGPTLPWKLFHNTVYTGAVAGHGPYFGNGQFGLNRSSGQPQHEEFNNIFVVLDGRTLWRDFYATSGLEVYDGNCFWSARQWKANPIGQYHIVHTTAGERKFLKSVDELRDVAYEDSHHYYPPGWERSGIELDPMLDESYRPDADGARTGAVDLSDSGWPGAGSRVERGAVLTAPWPPDA